MSNQLNITVLCGGQSAEHEISILSAQNVVAALDENKYNVSVIYITQRGEWYLLESPKSFLEMGPASLLQQKRCQIIVLRPGDSSKPWVSLENPEHFIQVDCVIPMLHGTLGEDGAMQGLLEILNLPYVGSGVLSSAMCMGKHITKQILRAEKIPVVDWITISRGDLDNVDYGLITKKLGPIFFVKPVGLGSSIGMSKVNSSQEFQAALEKAFYYDDLVLIESFIEGRELECSVLGNENPKASLPGEIVTHHDFYSYEAKYLDPKGAEIITPANVSDVVIGEIQKFSIKAYKALQCSGMARIDFFLQGGRVILNEVNPIPGFTDISMYTKNWQVSGIAYSELIDHLIQLAIERQQKQQQLSRVRLVENSFHSKNPS